MNQENKTEQENKEFDKFANKIKKVFDGFIWQIVRYPDKFILSAPITRDIINRILKDKSLIEDYHKGLDGSDPFKIAGYTTFWISKLRPIQILEEDPNKFEEYVNEYLAIGYAQAYFEENNMPQIYSKELTENLLYLLRYRTLTIRTVPLIYEAYIRGFSKGSNTSLDI